MEADQNHAKHARNRQCARVLTGRAIVAAMVAVVFAPTAAGGHDRAPPPGAPDPRFGASGEVLTDLGLGRADGTGVVVEEDGRIVVGGTTNEFIPGSGLALVAYRHDGTLDPTFGTGGIVITQFGSTVTASGAALAADHQGRLVQLGVYVDSVAAKEQFVLVRYRRNGTLDPTFGTGGIVLSDFGAQIKAVSAIAIQHDGRIVVAGAVFLPTSPSGANAALARYESDGALDASFGTGGHAFTDLGGSFKQQFQAVAIQHDGKIVAAGQTTSTGQLSFVVARYDREGALDPTFASGGIAATSFGGGSGAGGIAVQRDGKILVVGSGAAAVGDPLGFALARYDSLGALDPTFGVGGQVISVFPVGSAGATAVRLDRCGRAVLVGDIDSSAIGHGAFAVVRYETDGSLDPAFGASGLATTDFGGFLDVAHALAIQPDGKVVVVGGSDLSSDVERIAVARYEGEERCGCD